MKIETNCKKHGLVLNCNHEDCPYCCDLCIPYRDYGIETLGDK